MPQNLLTLLLVRDGILWLLVRLTLAAFVSLAGHGLQPSTQLSVQTVVLVTILALVDVTRRGERLLFANLGISRIRIGAIAAITAFGAELIVSFVVTLLRLGLGA